MSANERAGKFGEAMGEGTATGGYSPEQVWSSLRLWVAFARAHSAIAAREQHTLSKYNLTRGEFGVMDALFFKGQLSLSDIQRKIIVSSSGITYLVDRLEKKGMVKRQPSPDDRRSTFVSLTEEGEEFFKGIFPKHVRGLAEVFSGMTNEESGKGMEYFNEIAKRATSLLEKELSKDRGKED